MTLLFSPQRTLADARKFTVYTQLLKSVFYQIKLIKFNPLAHEYM